VLDVVVSLELRGSISQAHNSGGMPPPASWGKMGNSGQNTMYMHAWNKQPTFPAD